MLKMANFMLPVSHKKVSVKTRRACTQPRAARAAIRRTSARPVGRGAKEWWQEQDGQLRSGVVRLSQQRRRNQSSLRCKRLLPPTINWPLSSAQKENGVYLWTSGWTWAVVEGDSDSKPLLHLEQKGTLWRRDPTDEKGPLDDGPNVLDIF